MPFNFTSSLDEGQFLKEFSDQAQIDTPLTTSDAKDGVAGSPVTTYTISDILQGQTATKPNGVTDSLMYQKQVSALQDISKYSEGEAFIQQNRTILPLDLNNRGFGAGAGTATPGQAAATGQTPGTGTYSIRTGLASDSKWNNKIPSDIQKKTEKHASGAEMVIGTYNGTQVNMAYIGSWIALVEAAKLDGITISGGGFRSNAEQVNLRTQHGCGGASVYDRNCKASPPTAVPGRSRHEEGAAVDVHNCGAGSANFNWLSKNASKFGWQNLPSESWHWSVDGS